MAAKQRTVLIVEDDLDFRPLLEKSCKMAFDRFASILREIYRDLPEDGLYAITEPADTGLILLAADESQAHDMLMAHPDLDFVSVDLALAKDEYGLNDADGDLSSGVGGMRILHELRATNKRVLAVVVSGEKESSYPVKATLKYKVIGYREKARFDLRDYSRIVTAALLYQQALDHITQVELLNTDPDNLDLAQRCWKHAKQVIAEDEAATLRAVDLNFPEDLGLRIEVLTAKLDWTTKRPTNEWIDHALRNLVIGKNDWALMRIQFSDFDRFRKEYTDQVDELGFLVVGAIKHTLKDAKVTGAFVGVLPQEYLPEPCFIVILSANEERRLQALAAKIVEEYHKHNLMLLPFQFRDTVIKSQQDNATTVPFRKKLEEQLQQLLTQQKDTTTSAQARKKKQEEALQQFLPQMNFTFWNCEDDCDAFPDVPASIYTLTHVKPN